MDDCWCAGKPELARPRVDDFAAEGVQRVDGQVNGASVELAADLVAQPARGFGGESDHQDARGISSPLAHQVRDTSRESGGLAAAWAGDDGEWSVAGGNGGLLRRCETSVHLRPTAAEAPGRTVPAGHASGSLPGKRGF